MDESSHFARNSIVVHENPVLVCLTQFWCVSSGKNISTMVWEYFGLKVFIFKFLFFFSEKWMDSLRDRPPPHEQAAASSMVLRFTRSNFLTEPNRKHKILWYFYIKKNFNFPYPKETKKNVRLRERPGSLRRKRAFRAEKRLPPKETAQNRVLRTNS